MNYEQQLKRIQMFIDADWKCANCRGDLRQYGSPAQAHIINQSDRNLKKYGKEIIHHYLNIKVVCCDKCNRRIGS